MQAGEEPVAETEERHREPAQEGAGPGAGAGERDAEDQDPGAAVHHPGEGGGSMPAGVSLADHGAAENSCHPPWPP